LRERSDALSTAPESLRFILTSMVNLTYPSLRVALTRSIAIGVSLVLAFGHSAAVLAQSAPDIEPPSVELELVESAPADLSQVFTAQVTDDRELGDVSLHFRRAGQTVFEKIQMRQIGNTGFYSISIETDPGDIRSFEYYVQAIDLNGNRTVSGYAFDPFVRTISETDEPVAPLTSNTANTALATSNAATAAATAGATKANSSSSSLRWLYVALGIVAVGAIASQAGGGGGGGGNPATAPLVVNPGNPIP